MDMKVRAAESLAVMRGAIRDDALDCNEPMMMMKMRDMRVTCW